MEPREPQNWCPHCGGAYEPLQEYCLECGERLPTGTVVGVLAAAWQRRFSWYPGDWIWPALVFFVLTVIATAAAVAATSSKGASTLVATNSGLTVGPGQQTTVVVATNTLPTAPQPTITTGTLPTAPGNATTVVTTPPPATAAGGWPAGRSGYTNVLESVPVSVGRTRADAAARQAAADGLPETGVIDSSSHASLRNGFYVVFSGVYATAAQAAAALAEAHARGFPGAYEARVSH